MKEIWRRLRWLLHRKEFERELDEEIQHHLAMKNGGAKQFGNIALLKEDSRDMWTFTFWEQLAQDIRYGLRAMKANKLFTAMAVLSLALGIGANTAIYSFTDAIMIRALPVAHPEDLVILNWHAKQQPAIVHSFWGGGHHDPKAGFVSGFHPYAATEFLKTNRRIFQSLFTFQDKGRINLIFRGQAALADGENVSGTFFSGLGVVPAAGRLIDENDDRYGAPPVLVLSYDCFKARFAADPIVVGQSVLVQNVPYTIAGVAAPEFYGVRPGTAPDFYIPMHRIERARERLTDDHFYWQEAMGRLQPGVTVEQAQQALGAPYRRFLESTAANAKEHVDVPSLLVQEGGSGVDALRRAYSKPLLVLMTMVGLILTIACANIANLLLARAETRQREMAVRLSLGAGRSRILRQLLTESVMLSLAGAAAGIAVAVPGIRLIGWLLANGGHDFHLDATLDWRVLSFTLALAFFTGVIFGIAPALRATDDFRAARAGRRNLDGRRFAMGRALVVAQIALSLILAVAAALFVRTLSTLESTELGFDPDNVLLFRMNAGEIGYKRDALVRFDENLRRKFSAIPGVLAGTVSQFALVAGSMSAGQAVVSGEKISTSQLPVGPGFFTTMRNPLLLGREIEARDIAGPPVAVVNEVFANRFFPGESVIGHKVGLGKEQYTIIGLAKTSRYDSLKRETPPVVYVPYSRPDQLRNYITFALRTKGNPLALMPAVRRIAGESDSRVPISQVTTQSAQIDETLGQERTFADLCTCFAVLALGISCVGLYGTMAYSVARRTAEIGVRVALGAQRRGILWMVLREVLALSSAGLAIGLAVAWETAHFVASFLFGVKPTDPVAMSASAAVLAAAAIVAGYAPAWRASRIDPMVALRHE